MSKIPEGATHTFSSMAGISYRRQAGDRWEAYVDGDWVLLCGGMPSSYVPIQAEPEWVPAVGSIVHCATHCRLVEILKVPELVPYVTAPCRATDNNELFWGGKFSEVKTPEQIAADERDKARTFAINAMTEDGKTANEPEALWQFRMKVVGEMLDLGFRMDKQVEK